jgi:hypothetical protein
VDSSQQYRTRDPPASRWLLSIPLSRPHCTCTDLAPPRRARHAGANTAHRRLSYSWPDLHPVCIRTLLLPLLREPCKALDCWTAPQASALSATPPPVGSTRVNDSPTRHERWRRHSLQQKQPTWKPTNTSRGLTRFTGSILCPSSLPPSAPPCASGQSASVETASPSTTISSSLRRYVCSDNAPAVSAMVRNHHHLLDPVLSLVVTWQWLIANRPSSRHGPARHCRLSL